MHHDFCAFYETNTHVFKDKLQAYNFYNNLQLGTYIIYNNHNRVEKWYDTVLGVGIGHFLKINFC